MDRRNRPIAVFDSGVGGISVLKALVRRLSAERFVYLGDTAHAPYGPRPTAEIRRLTLENLRALDESEPFKAAVIACNTATSVGLEELRRRHSVPIFGMEPAVAKALDRDPDHRVLVIATNITCKGKMLQDQIARVDKKGLVDTLPMPKLVEFAEAMNFNGPEVKAYLEKQFAPYDLSQYSTLVLGCTHFNYFKDTLREVLPANVCMTDACDIVLGHLIHTLD